MNFLHIILLLLQRTEIYPLSGNLFFKRLLKLWERGQLLFCITSLQVSVSPATLSFPPLETSHSVPKDGYLETRVTLQFVRVNIDMNKFIRHKQRFNSSSSRSVELICLRKAWQHSLLEHNCFITRSKIKNLHAV